ncbi:MAG: CBS domain-containing protein [Leptospiraceae bacterium]|nr:CBS domain-containing protein [Leptospiraceae bacterium]MDW7977139.1 CBS domain-containing protein [Leptospiraceae bacterium]
MKPVTISDLMTKKFITVSPEDYVIDVIELFEKHKVHHLPVKDKKTKEIIGMLSEKDIKDFINLMKLLQQEKYKLKVKDIMTTPIFAYYEDVGIDQAAQAMLDNKIHAIMVVSRDTEEYIGIITVTDLLKYLAQHKQYHNP